MVTVAIPTTPQAVGDSEAKLVTRPRGGKIQGYRKNAHEFPTSEETTTTGSTRL
jgi:hypothetical protein